MFRKKALLIAVWAMILIIGFVLSACAAPTAGAPAPAERTTHGHPALADVRVRQAIALAIDREAITRDLLLGLTEPAATFWDNTPYADPSIEPWPYDPERAKQLLDEAGWIDSNGDGVRDKDGLELVLTYGTTTKEIRQDVQAVIQQQLAAVGIKVELSNYDPDIFFASYGEGGPAATGQLDIMEWSDVPYGFPDPASAYWLCSEIPSDESPAGTNYQYLCDPELDRLFQLQATQTDFAERQQTFWQISRLMFENVYWLGLWQDPDQYAVGPRLLNVKLSGVTPFFNVAEWDVADSTGDRKIATLSWTQEFDSLNPHYTNMFFSTITQQFWNCWAWQFDENNEPYPHLVTEIPSEENGGISADGKTITMHLRDDIVWSDGEPITSDDFVFTYETAIDPRNTVTTAYPYDSIESIEAPDERTVVIRFAEPFAPWLGSLWHGLLPAHILRPVVEADGTLDNADWNTNPTVGCGPFVFVEWESGSYARFVANENYWLGRPILDEIFIRFVPDDASQVAALKAGDVDMGIFISYPDIPGLLEAGINIVRVNSGYNEGLYLLSGQ